MASNQVIRRADPSSIQNKVLVGYQGWFTCAGDGPPVHQGHHGWLHWLDKPLNEGGRPNFDLFPDVSEYDTDELYPVPGLSFPSPNGQPQPAKLFSSRNPKTVKRHFHWMARHGIDGAFLQRFATQCEVDGNTTGATADLMRLRDEILDRVKEAAESENRVWAVIYDVTGVPADRVEHVLRVDWDHLLRDKRILDSPYYMKERGQPVVAIWGLGFVEAHHDPQTVASIIRHIKSITPGGAYVWGGVPSQWRTLTGDMDPNPAFLDVYKNEFDALSPWTIGRYNSRESMDNFLEERTREDIKELKDLPKRVDYFPTIWPGGSSYNMTEGRLALNDAPRDGGKFIWRQLWSVKHMGVRTVYVAMFDEYDEGTAILPAVPLKRSLPRSDDPNRQFPFIALDADGVDNLPPDWYLKICGFASEAMKDERRVYEDLPKKELDDYWASRPKYETSQQAYASKGGEASVSTATASAGGSIAGGSSSSYSQPAVSTTTVKPPARQNTGAWGNLGGDMDDLPPPAYSLEASEEPEPISAATTAPTAATPSNTGSISSATPANSSATSPPTFSSPSSSIPGIHRSSSYDIPSVAHNSSQVGLGRASTYSASPASTRPPAGAVSGSASPVHAAPSNPSSPATSLYPPPRFAPPTTPPPGQPPRTSSPLSRPPMHPASPLSHGSSTGSNTSLSNQSPHGHPVGLAPATNTSSSNLHNNFASAMNLGPSNAGPNSPALSNVAASGPVSSQPSSAHLYTTLSQPGVASPGNYSYVTTPGHASPPVTTASSSAFVPPTGPASSYYSGAATSPATLGHQPPSGGASPWNAPSSTSSHGYFSHPNVSPYGGSQAASPAGMPVPSFAPPTSPPPTMPATSSYPSSPNPYQSYSNPSSQPHSPWAPPTSSPSSYPTGPSFPSQPGQSSSPYMPSGSTSSFPSPGQPSTSNSNAPVLPPRPGEPGGFVAPPKNDTFMGGFVHKASGMVDKYTPEVARPHIDKAAQVGSKLLGKFTK